jgi:hypothetical protein
MDRAPFDIYTKTEIFYQQEYCDGRRVSLSPSSNGETNRYENCEKSIFSDNPKKSKVCRRFPTDRRIDENFPERVLVIPGAKENAKIVAAAKKDPDAKPLAPAQLNSMCHSKRFLAVSHGWSFVAICEQAAVSPCPHRIQRKTPFV